MSSKGGAQAGRQGRVADSANFGERVCALVLLGVAAPLVALIALCLLLTSGAPVFYHGTRLGRGRRPFRMPKLRTLRLGADSVTGGDLLGNRLELTVRGGRFLRATRLDELPQLWCIVRGEMSFIGPRPERPEVFAAKCRQIPGYERRFDVRPGLIGISQLFTPHGTPKRYRTLIDNGVIRRRSHDMRRLRIVGLTVWVVAAEVLRRSARQLVLLHARLTGRYREKRRLRRVAPRGAVVRFARPGSSGPHASRLLDINAETLRVECDYEPGLERSTQFELDIPVHGLAGPAHRTALCTGRVTVRRGGPTRAQLLVRYQPSTARSEYMIHQYFLRDSLARPPRAWPDAPHARLPAPASVAPGGPAGSVPGAALPTSAAMPSKHTVSSA